MDIPITGMSEMIFATGDKQTAVSNDQYHRLLLRIILVYAVIILVPTPAYNFLGWPVWEFNYMWQGVDINLDTLLRAVCFSAFFACIVLLALHGLEDGIKLLQKIKVKLSRKIYLALLVLPEVIVLSLFRDTFKVADTHAKHVAGESYTLWRKPLTAELTLTYTYSRSSLDVFFLQLIKEKQAGYSVKCVYPKTHVLPGKPNSGQ